jgi:hypothetical protein
MWTSWLRLDQLELRPFRGVRIGADETIEFPLGRFRILTPELLARPATALTFAADDYWSWVVTADFTGPAVAYAGGIVNTIRRLIEEAGIGPVTIDTLKLATAESSLLEGTRHEAIASSAKSIDVEVYVDRFGAATIADTRQLEYPETYLVTKAGGTAVGMAVKPDWSGVYNSVSVTSSAQDVSFPAQVASIVWSQHPATKEKIGPRVMKYSSPLLRTAEQGMSAAVSILRRVSAPASMYSYTCVPDASMDVGDSVFGSTLDGLVLPFQIQSITHPLNVEDAAQVTMMSTQLDSGEWQPQYSLQGIRAAIFPDNGVYPDRGALSILGS